MIFAGGPPLSLAICCARARVGIPANSRSKLWVMRSARRSSYHFAKMIIQLINEAGMVVKAFKVYRCWPSEYHALPDLEANGHAVAIETLKLENEGWERDEAVGEPDESA